MRIRIASVLGLVLAATALAATSVAAQWPTTCVELNDIVEAHLGNDRNVGIYQRVFGDQAEAACQNDHRDDVRSVFAWAIGSDEPAMQPAPAPAPAATAQAHPDYERVRQVALARGADDATAAGVAGSVIGRNAVDAFLRGQDRSVVYGTADCQYRSDACPLAPERPFETSSQGSNDSVQQIHLPQGLYIVSARYNPNDNFIVHLEGQSTIFLFNQLWDTGYTETTLRLGGGHYLLDVQATGGWTITWRQV